MIKVRVKNSLSSEPHGITVKKCWCTLGEGKLAQNTHSWNHCHIEMCTLATGLLCLPTSTVSSEMKAGSWDICQQRRHESVKPVTNHRKSHIGDWYVKHFSRSVRTFERPTVDKGTVDAPASQIWETYSKTSPRVATFSYFLRCYYHFKVMLTNPNYRTK